MATESTVDRACAEPTLDTDSATEIVTLQKSTGKKCSKSTESEIFQRNSETLAVWQNGHKWLVIEREKKLMFCKSCIAARVSNSFTKGTSSFKSSNINEHVKAKGKSSHKAALGIKSDQANQANMEQRMATEYDKQILARLEVVLWLTQENIPFHKYSPLLSLMDRLGTLNIS